MSEEIFILALLSLLIAFRAKPIGDRLSIIDYPDGSHKTHDRPTPLVGGFIIALPLFIFFVARTWEHPQKTLYIALLIGLCGSFFMGLFDDRRSLPPLFRLLYAAALALTCVAIEPAFLIRDFDFTFSSEPVPLALYAVGFSVLALVGMINALNMTDGINGIAVGISLIWSLFLLYYSPPETFEILLLLTLCLCIALVFNLKGYLFLGDSGAYSTGLIISFLTIYVYNQSKIELPADTVVVWFLLPILDCIRLTFLRPFLGRSPTSADKNHIHHLLQRVVPKNCVVFLIWLMVGIPGLISIVVSSLTPFIILAVAIFYIGLLIWASVHPQTYEPI